MLLLQEFEFDIQHRLGTQHAVADYLSGLENGADVVNGDDDFPDRAILHIEVDDPEWKHTSHEDKWLIEMSTFLSTGLPPPQMRTDEKKRLAVRSRNFCLLQDTLYHKGNDSIWRRSIRSEEK